MVTHQDVENHIFEKMYPHEILEYISKPKTHEDMMWELSCLLDRLIREPQPDRAIAKLVSDWAYDLMKNEDFMLDVFDDLPEEI